jgi:DNA-binding XRE family transcriptional regulator
MTVEGNGACRSDAAGLFHAGHAANNTYRLWTHSLHPAIRSGMSKSDRSRFGKKIRELRLARSLTQEELAHIAALHPTYIGGVERGERNIGLDNVLKLARALNEHPSALFVDFPK